MRAPHGVLFIGQHQCREFECLQEPLPAELNVLLCLVDGAERRRHLQARLDALRPPPDPGVGDPNVAPEAKK
jgi:hypothetical protein